MSDYMLGATVALIVSCLFFPIIFQSRKSKRRRPVLVRFVAVSLALVLIYGTGAAYYSSRGIPSSLTRLSLYGASDQSLGLYDTALLNPSDYKGWEALGEQLRREGHFKEAVAAFARAMRLSEKEPKVALSYAKTLVLAADGDISPEAREIFVYVHSKQPQNEEAQFFMGLLAISDGRTAEGRDIWNKLVKKLPEDAPLRRMTEKYLNMIARESSKPANSGAAALPDSPRAAAS